jgi:calcium-dependent protein kinase
MATKFINEERKFKEDYEMQHILGSGAFGEVWLCKHIYTKNYRAVKIVKKSLSPTGKEPPEIKEVIYETSILLQLDHPNILKIFSVYEDALQLYIVMEYLHGSELLDHIMKSVCFTECQAAYLMKQLLYAVNYSHKNHIIHMYSF